MAVLAIISAAFENAVSERLHFQARMAPENGGASCPAGNAIQSAFRQGDQDREGVVRLPSLDQGISPFSIAPCQ